MPTMEYKDGELRDSSIYGESCHDLAKKVINLLCTKKIIGHNLSFDSRFVKCFYGIDITPSIHADTILLVHTVSEEGAGEGFGGSFGLKDIILEQKFCNANKIKVIVNGSTNGIDTSFFSPSLIKLEEMQQLKLDLNIAPDDFVFVFVGRLVKDKGINELVTAFEDLHKLNSKAKLLLVGDYESDLDPLLPEVLDSINENPAIISVGFQYDVRPYFSISDVLVFPSYREGFPNVVMQAGAMGLPSIVSDINGCNEIIENNRNGFIIPVKDSQAVFEKMKLYLYDNSIYTFHKSVARDRIESRYQQSLVWEAILLEYKFLMND
jgi:glycosyltransferase involved in cell wall biosynthesis